MGHAWGGPWDAPPVHPVCTKRAPGGVVKWARKTNKSQPGWDLGQADLRVKRRGGKTSPRMPQDSVMEDFATQAFRRQNFVISPKIILPTSPSRSIIKIAAPFSTILSQEG